MSTGEKFFRLTDYLTDRLNPILVKETRQALKSRQFIITFMLLLTVAWLISVFGIMVYGPAIEYGSAGRVFFGWYAGVIGFATLFVVPFGSFRSMLAERDQDTYELLSISTLSPRQIVTGKLLSSVVQVFIYYSAIAPFIAFTSLLQGFDFPMVVLLLSIGLVWSAFVSMIAITLSTLSNSRQWQAMNTIGMIALLLWQMGMVFGLGVTALWESIPFDREEFWWTLICCLIGVGSYFLLAQQIAVSRLTFESGNRSSGIRVITTMQFWLVWSGVLAYGWWYGAINVEGEAVFVFAMLSSIHWMISGLVFSTESEHVSRRLRRSVPSSGFRRSVIAPWLPGGRRGLLLLTMHLAAMTLIVWIPYWPAWIHELVPLPSWSAPICNAVTAMALYVFIYVGFGAAIGRWGQAISPEFRPAHARVLTILLAALAMVFPYLFYLLEISRWPRFDSWTHVMNPFSAIELIVASEAGGSSRHPELTVLFLLMLSSAAGLVFLVNLKPMMNGVSELRSWQLSAAQSNSAEPIAEWADVAFEE